MMYFPFAFVVNLLKMRSTQFDEMHLMKKSCPAKCDVLSFAFSNNLQKMRRTLFDEMHPMEEELSCEM